MDSYPAGLIRDKFTFDVRGRDRPIRKILPIIEKGKCTPGPDEESALWGLVLACDDESDWGSDVPCVILECIAYDSAHRQSGCCGDTPDVLLASKHRDGLVPTAGNLWDPNQGELSGD